MNTKLLGAVLGTLAIGGMNVARAEDKPAEKKEEKGKKGDKKDKKGEKSCSGDKGCKGKEGAK
jgi:hypothetical protein